MILPKNLFQFFKQKKINFFVGVPDSLQKSLESNLIKNKNHIVAANEGSAVAIASGYYTKTKKLPVVYMQNSGLGNSINPLVSILSKNVYKIPIILLIGWRGATGTKDEPQHYQMGKITKKLLNLLDIEYCTLSNNSDLIRLSKLISISKKKRSIVACLIKKNSFINSSLKKKQFKSKNIRINYLKEIFKITNKNYVFFTSTGYLSREFNHLNTKNFNNKFKSFLNVGGMGHTSSIAMGYSIYSNNNIICLDGDGSIIMHLGSLLTISAYKKKFKYILFNNNLHESVGSMNTNSNNINFKMLSKSLGFNNYYFANNVSIFKKNYKKFLNSKRKSFFEVQFKPGSLENLTRPTNLEDIYNKLLN